MRYFAYGSDPTDVCRPRWCEEKDAGGLRYVCRASLPDHRLTLRCSDEPRPAALELVPSLGRVVFGALFEIADANEHRERGTAVVVLDEHGNEISACTASGDAATAESGVLIDLVFVYGTLRRGECRHGVLHAHGVDGIELAEVDGELFDLGPYPGMRLSRGVGTVRGELVRLRHVDRALPDLDGVEGFRGFGNDSWFRRSLAGARTASGEVRRAWVYVYDRVTEGRTIASGDWLNR